MKCCFCKSELVKSESTTVDIWNCPNENCKAHTYFGDKDFWQILTDGKKAQDALKEIENLLQRHFVREQEEGFMVNWDVVAKIIKEKIASITKGDKE